MANETPLRPIELDAEQLLADHEIIASVKDPTARVLIGEVMDGASEEAQRLAVVGTAAVMAGVISIGAAANVGETTKQSTDNLASPGAVMKIVENIHNSTTTSTPNATQAPKTRAQIIKSFKSPLSIAMATATPDSGSTVHGAVVKVPAETTPAAIALITKATIDNSAGTSANATKNVSAQQIEQSIVEVNDLASDTEVITPADHSVIVVPVQETEKISATQVADAITANIIEAHKTPPPAPVTSPVPSSPEFNSSDVSIQSLVKQVLNNPNVTIANPGDDRVRKSLEDALDDGKTFAHDLSQEGNQNVSVNPRTMQIALYLAEKGHKIVIDSMTTGNHVGDSEHWHGNAIDILPLGIPDNLPNYKDYDRPDYIAQFQVLYADLWNLKDVLHENELIYAFPNPGMTGLKHGLPFNYWGDTRNNHYGHVHVDSDDETPIPPEVFDNLIYGLSPQESALIDSLDLAPDQKGFLKQIIPVERKVAAEMQTNGAVGVAQAIEESDYGRKAPGNNYFGMKATSGWTGPKQLLDTFEYDEHGNYYKTKAWFKVFDSMEASVRAHAENIVTAPWFADAKTNWQNWQQYLAGLENPGEPAYASAKEKYVEAITRLINQYHLAELTHSG